MALLIVGLLPAAPAFAQSESASYDWEGTVTGAESLDQCDMTEDDKRLLVQAVRNNLDPENFPSATINVMPVSELQRLEETRAREAGYNPDAFWSRDSISAAANVQSRIVSYDCREWSTGREWDVVVVEYQKSEEKQASDQKVFKLQAEANVVQDDNVPLQEQTPQPGPGGGGPTLRGGLSRAEICARNPQAYQCLYGVPGRAQQANTGGPINTRPISGGTTQQSSGTRQTPARQTPTIAQTLLACPEGVDPLTWARMHSTGNEALDTLRATGIMADRYLDAMGQVFLEEMARLAQPRDGIWHRRLEVLDHAVGALGAYLTNDNAANHEMLRQRADRALKAYMRHPEKLGAEILVNMITAKGASLSGRACKAGVLKVGESIESSRVVEATKNWIKIRKAQLDFGEKDWGNACGYHPNPDGLKNACIPSMWADYHHDRDGFPWTAQHFKWEPEDVPTPHNRIPAVQKQLFGDQSFPHLDGDDLRAHLQSEGIPANMPNGLPSVVQDLRAAGEGAQGFVFVEYQSGRRHGFRSALRNGEAVFKDSAGNRAGGFNFDPSTDPDRIPATVYHYLVDGPDIVRPR